MESETRAIWTWFLEILKDDVGIEIEYKWTFMSNKQKWLIAAYDGSPKC